MKPAEIKKQIEKREKLRDELMIAQSPLTYNWYAYKDAKNNGDLVKIKGRKYDITQQINLLFKKAQLLGWQECLEEVEKLIDEIPAKYTYCKKCTSGFDEDSEECCDCNSKEVLHYELDISREELKSKVQDLK